MPYYPERKPEESGQEKKKPNLTGKQKKGLRLFLVVFFSALTLYATVRLIVYGSELSASRKTSEELQQVYQQAKAEETYTPAPVLSTPLPVSPPTAFTEAPQVLETAVPVSNSDLLQSMEYPNNKELRMSDRFKALRKKSPYAVGWISMDGVEEAVAQKDNTYFLTHDASGRKNSNGAIFLDADIFLTMRPYTLILYGHNMKSGNMFGKLRKYKESTYFYKHRIITFDSLYEDGQYAVFSVLELNTVPGTAHWYDLWSLNSNSYAEREEAIRELERRSAVSSTLDVQADEQLLLLVTCLDGENERLVVAARRLREGETADTLTIRH